MLVAQSFRDSHVHRLREDWWCGLFFLHWAAVMNAKKGLSQWDSDMIYLGTSESSWSQSVWFFGLWSVSPVMRLDYSFRAYISYCWDPHQSIQRCLYFLILTMSARFINPSLVTDEWFALPWSSTSNSERQVSAQETCQLASQTCFKMTCQKFLANVIIYHCCQVAQSW